MKSLAAADGSTNTGADARHATTLSDPPVVVENDAHTEESHGPHITYSNSWSKFEWCVFGGIYRASALGIRINTRFSLPMGIYARTSDGAYEPDRVLPGGPRRRGTERTGLSVHWSLAPMALLPVSTRAGDTVEMSAEGISVNGKTASQTLLHAGPLWQTAPGLAERTISSGRWICLGGVFI